LLKFFINLNVLVNKALKCAVDIEHKALVKLPIVHDDVDVNINASGQTPLSWATVRGHKVVVKLLLKTSKADMDSKDYHDGQTPLSRACREWRRSS
jgi:ankyrin repeat protein